MKEKTIWCGDMPKILDSPFLADIHACVACTKDEQAIGTGEKVCPAAEGISYAVSDRNSTTLRCKLISDLVKGNTNRALKLGEEVEAHHGKNFRCDPLTGVKKIRRWLRKMGVELEDDRPAQGDVSEAYRVQSEISLRAARHIDDAPPDWE